MPSDLIQQHAKSVGSSFARDVTPANRRVSTRNQGVVPTLGGVTIGSDFTIGQNSMKCRARALVNIDHQLPVWLRRPRRSIVNDHVHESGVNFQYPVVFDVAKFTKSVHEEADSGSGRANSRR